MAARTPFEVHSNGEDGLGQSEDVRAGRLRPVNGLVVSTNSRVLSAVVCSSIAPFGCVVKLIFATSRRKKLVSSKAELSSSESSSFVAPVASQCH